MKYIREYQNGCGGSDPRNKWFAVYKCAACGHESDIIMSDPSSFDRRDRRCPKCGAMEAGDLRKNLETKRVSLEAQRKVIQREIDDVIRQLDRLPVEGAS